MAATVLDRRNAFLSTVRSYTRSSNEPHFATTIDDLIHWSVSHAPRVVLRDKDYRQGVVAFDEATSGFVLWSAYPRIGDGAKLELVSGTIHLLGDELHQSALSL